MFIDRVGKGMLASYSPGCELEEDCRDDGKKAAEELVLMLAIVVSYMGCSQQMQYRQSIQARCCKLKARCHRSSLDTFGSARWE